MKRPDDNEASSGPGLNPAFWVSNALATNHGNVPRCTWTCEAMPSSFTHPLPKLFELGLERLRQFFGPFAE